MDKQIQEWDNMVDELDGRSELLCEMAKVADFNGYKLIVWTNDEGEIPHFHIMTGKNPLHPEFDACIKFKESEYYPHGGKHTDRLPSNQMKAMIELLKSKDQYALGDQTIWQSLMIEWNRNDNRVKIPLDTPMPDYRRIIYPTNLF